MDNQENFRSPNEEDRFADGFQEGFGRAREIFWRDFMRKAGELRLMIDQMKESLGDSAEDSRAIELLASMEGVYRNTADTVARSHTLYPGALSNDADPNDKRYTVRYDDLYKY